MTLAQRILAIADRRPPDVVIGEKYLRRWYVIPRNPFFNIYLHHFQGSDDDRALHDHPWLFNLSWLLRGSYREWTRGTYEEWNECYDARKLWRITHTPPTVGRVQCVGSVKFRWGRSPHRIQLTHGDCWTLFITGPRIREWGFYCPKGWKHWRDFTKNDVGCGE